MTPTFWNSSRSTRGMTRITAYSNNCFSRTLRLLDENPRRGESRLQKFDVHLSPAVGVRHETVEPDDLRREFRVNRFDQRVVGDRAGEVIEREVEARAGPKQVL